MNSIRLLDQSFDDFFSIFGYKQSDIKYLDDKIILYVELPGVKKEDIDIITEDCYLNIKANNRIKDEKFNQTYKLNDKLNIQNIKSKFEDGLLIVTIKYNKAIKSSKVPID